MIVVADTSPFIALVNIGHLEVLPKLFGQILVPPAVVREFALLSRPQAVRDLASGPPSWLIVRPPLSIQLIPEMHPGEIEALSLAIEIGADLILIDERRAYREAVARHLNAIGTVRVLERAAAERMIDLKDAFERLKRTDFWIADKLLDERLKLFDQQYDRGR